MGAGRVLSVALVLTAGAPLAGCLGADDVPRARTEAALVAASTPVAAELEFVALTLVFELEEDSVAALSITGIEVEEMPAQPAAFVAHPDAIDPGERRALGALAVARDADVGPVDVSVTLMDGLGEARLALTIGPWRAATDVDDVVRLKITSPGEVVVASLAGPVPITARTEKAVPTYGYLAWPDGRREPLAGFAFPVQVPAAYPTLPAGLSYEFAVEAERRSVTWELDGEEIATGARATIAPGQGRHTLVALVDGSSALLAFRSDQTEHFAGTVQAGTSELRRMVPGINAEAHRFEVQAHSRLLVATLTVAERGIVPADLDLYLTDADGATVALARTPGEAGETLEVSGLAGGAYTLTVYAASGALVEYTLDARIAY